MPKHRDRFGRVIDQNWLNTTTGVTTDRFQYTYDRDGDVLSENNLVDAAVSELYGANSSTSGDSNTRRNEWQMIGSSSTTSSLGMRHLVGR